MHAPDMREYVGARVGQTLFTVAKGRPNTIVDVTNDRAVVETATGHQNHASLTDLQALADRIFAGEEVVLELRGRSAFHAAVLATLPELDYALDPRRFWVKDPPGAFDAEYRELFQNEDPATAREGREIYHMHRSRERSAVLCRLKKQAVLSETGRLACEACDFDFESQYGPVGEGYIECHHTVALAEGDERETELDDLALVCANCHRVIHRSRPMLSVEELRDLLRCQPNES
jgi:HNH endonuclease